MHDFTNRQLTADGRCAPPLARHSHSSDDGHPGAATENGRAMGPPAPGPLHHSGRLSSRDEVRCWARGGRSRCRGGALPGPRARRISAGADFPPLALARLLFTSQRIAILETTCPVSHQWPPPALCPAAAAPAVVPVEVPAPEVECGVGAWGTTAFAATWASPYYAELRVRRGGGLVWRAVEVRGKRLLGGVFVGGG